MSNWENILKIQVLDTTTGLSTINEPMVEDKDCCELAREKFLEEQAKYYHNEGQAKHFDNKKYMGYFEEILAMTDCKTFREILQEVKNRPIRPESARPKSSIPYLNTLRFWEECEK